MLGCGIFLGCFGNCEEQIKTGTNAISSGTATVEHVFNNVLISDEIELTEYEEIIIPNTFTPGMIHDVTITEQSGKIHKFNFKVRTQC